MKNHFYLVLFLFIHTGLTAQIDKEFKRTAYMLIDENINLNCQNYPYTKNWIGGNVLKSVFSDRTNFHLCKHKFMALHSDIEIIDKEEFNKLNLWSFGQMQYERLRKGYILFNYCFEKIYFIEKIGTDKYKKYLVEWESALNMNRVDIYSKY